MKVLSRVFRGKFLAGLQRLYCRGKLPCSGPAVALADPLQFAQLLRYLHRHEWVVYAKPAFGGPLQVLRYLGRYTHRVAISNHLELVQVIPCRKKNLLNQIVHEIGVRN